MKRGSAGRICIVQPPTGFAAEGCCLPSDYVGVGLLAVSAWLEQHGFETRIFHFPIAAGRGMNALRVLREISLFSPQVAAVGMNWVHFSAGAVETAEKLRETLPGVPILLGGQHASLFHAEIADKLRGVFDAIIVGEAEKPLLEICRSVCSGGGVPDGLPGVVPRGGGSPQAFDYVEDVDSLPLQSFARIWPGYDRPVAALSTVRGACPHSCAFCLEGSRGIAWKGTSRRLHSERYIAEQALRFSNEGKTILTIQDQFSHRGDAGAEALAREFKAHGVRPAEFNIFAEPGAYSGAGFESLAGITDGLVSVDFGVESGSEKVARLSRLSFKREAFLEQLGRAADAGVLPFTWWMTGLPGEGPDEVEETRRFIVETMKRGGIPRWITPLVLFPQTEMSRRAEDFGVRPRFKTFAHFTRFSFEKPDELGCYPALATHDGLMTGEETALAAVGLKRAVVENWSLLEAFYESRPAVRAKFEGMTKMLTAEKGSGFALGSFF